MWKNTNGTICIALDLYNYIVVDTNVSVYNIGDIIEYEAMRNGDLLFITHRIVSIDTENGQYIVKGDANTGTETIDEDQIIGKVCEIVNFEPDLID